MSHARQAWAKIHDNAPMPEVFVLAVRGYYSNTFAPSGNNVGEYDDAIFIVTKNSMTPCWGNTDPSRIGWNGHAGKFMARLKPGVWTFRPLKQGGGR